MDAEYRCCTFTFAGHDKRLVFMLSVLLLQVLALMPATAVHEEVPLRLRTLLDSPAPSPAVPIEQADDVVGARTRLHTLSLLS
jgi:hypothetical protein